MRQIDGVKDWDTDSDENLAYVKFDDAEVSLEQIKKVLEKKKFPVESTTEL